MRFSGWMIAVCLAAGNLGAQPVHLEIRPRLGDTLRMRMDQKVEMTGTMSTAAGDSVMTIVSSIQLFTRAVPQSYNAKGTIVLAIADSAMMLTRTGEHVRHPIQGQTVQLRVAPDGATEVLGDPDTQNELRDLFSHIPATLPRDPVRVGESWTREMNVPISPDKGRGKISSTFRLDSLTQNGDIAYISIRGSLSHDRPDSNDVTGSITGCMRVDRRMGWMTDTKAVIIVTSVVRFVPGRPTPLRTPMRVRTQITQWLRAVRPQ